MKHRINSLLQKDQAITVLVLLVISIISFGIFRSTIISSDDWSYFVWKYAFGELHPVLWNDRRPFVLVFYSIMASIFGLHVEYYYFANFLILFFSAYLVYTIFKQVFPDYGWLASLISIVYLIYPIDYTRTWFIMIYIRLMWLISLVAILLMIKFALSGNWWILLAAMLAIAFPLGAYEGQFGVIALTGVLIAVAMPQLPVKRRVIPLGGIFLVGILFLIWRFFIQENFLEIQDTYVEAIQFTPTILFQRYLQGLDIFARGWFAPVQAQLGRSGFEITGWWLVWIIVSYLKIQHFLSKRPGNNQAVSQKKGSKTKPYLTFFLLGGAFWIAGYVPIIALYAPSLSGHASRVNLFALPGAALMLVSVVAMLATVAVPSIRTQQLLVISTFLPFVLVGIFVQLQVNRENQIAWDTQKKIWNGVFETIPNIVDQKRVVVIIPGYKEMQPFQSLPFLSGWGIEAGAQVLYNNPTIGANYYYKDIQPTELLFTENGFRPIPTDKTITYKKLIFVYYNPDSQTVELVENLGKTLSLSFKVNNYSPHENIAPANSAIAKFRWLVQ